MTTKKASKRKIRSDDLTVTESSGNVFADLGLPNPHELLRKADLTHRICEIIKARRLTQVQAAKILGVDQPKVSALVRGRLDQFSLDRLVKFLELLDQEVTITIRPKKQPQRQPV